MEDCLFEIFTFEIALIATTNTKIVKFSKVLKVCKTVAFLGKVFHLSLNSDYDEIIDLVNIKQSF